MIERRTRTLGRCGVLLLAGALWLLALASSGQGHSPPSLDFVGVDAQNHLGVSWTMPAGDTAQAILWNTSGSLDAEVFSPPGRGQPLSSNDGEAIECGSCTSLVTAKSFEPGTYYVQVVIRGPHANEDGSQACESCTHWSNVLSVTVPESGGGDGGTLPTGGGLGVPGLSATVREVGGDSTVVHADGTSEPLRSGLALRVGDTIKTGKNGSAVVDFNPGSSTVRILQNSSFTLEGKRGFALTRGRIRVLFKRALCRLRKGAGVCDFTTRWASIGVRGTVFTVEATKRVTRIRTWQGAVVLRNRRGKPKRTVVVKRGFEGRVRGAHPPTKRRS